MSINSKCFYYGVFAYNEENFIEETLNSIRYQVDNYGSEYENIIYIYDDCSSDSTLKVINAWKNRSECSFKEIRIIENDVNRGTVYNYNNFIRSINGELFKTIAGDDLLASNNIYLSYKNIDNNTIINHLNLLYDGKNLYFNEWNLIKYANNKLKLKNKNKPSLLTIMLGNYFHTPSTIYTKSLYNNSGCESYNSKYRLFEDDPSWYAIVKNNDNLNVVFDDTVIVFYRQHENNVSKTIRNKQINSVFNDERASLLDVYIEECTCIDKVIMKLYRRNSIIYRIWKELAYSVISRKVKKTEYYRTLVKAINEEIIKQSEYLKTIKGVSCRRETL